MKSRGNCASSAASSASSRALASSSAASRCCSRPISSSGGRTPASPSAASKLVFSRSGTLSSSRIQSFSSARPASVIWYVVRSGCLPSRPTSTASMKPYFSRFCTTV